jgi:hypothetical protein
MDERPRVNVHDVLGLGAASEWIAVVAIIWLCLHYGWC